MITGQKIKMAREAAGLTLEEIARQIGTTKQHVYRWEHNRIKPSSKYIEPLGRALGMSISELYGEERPDHLSEAEGRLLDSVRNDPKTLNRLLRMVSVAESMDDESWEHLIGLMKKLRPDLFAKSTNGVQRLMRVRSG